MNSRNPYAFRASLNVPYEEVLARIKNALQVEGFGILTSIDMQATLREKLGAEIGPYSILGACNPSLARQALDQDVEAGLVLPCTVVVYADDGGSEICIANPLSLVDLIEKPALRAIAKDAAARLKRVLESMKREGK